MGLFQDGVQAPVKPPDPPEEDVFPNVIWRKGPDEYYRLLGVSVEASSDEIFKGYRKQALSWMLWHPDRSRHKAEVSREHFSQLNDALDALSHPRSRAEYDAGKLKDQVAGRDDESDQKLTPVGIKYRKQGWGNYVLLEGRLDDDRKRLILDESHPCAPKEKLRIFWRRMGELAYDSRESGEDAGWPQQFVSRVWKDIPAKWPSTAELAIVDAGSKQSWDEKRILYKRIKQKLLVAVTLHEAYLAIPDRESREREWAEKLGLFRSPDSDQNAAMELEGAGAGYGMHLVGEKQ